MKQKKICIVTTLWSSINNWIKPFLPEYNKYGIEVTIVCNMDSTYESQLQAEYPFVKTFPIAFPRGMSIFGSITSTYKLYKFLASNNFDLIQYSTPNASMYGAVAAKLARVPIRLYCQWGMVFVTRKGFTRWIFKNIERFICRFSTEIQPDSFGNLAYCRSIGLYDARKSRVIWNGSAKGINLENYDIKQKEVFAREIRRQYHIPDNAPVIGFVGRLGKEKGCNELFKAYKELKSDYPSLRLLFVGPLEKEETIQPDLLRLFKEDNDIIKTGRVSGVERYISAMDVLILPSYREGFGMSVVEASAMGVPVITTKYPGPSSAMEENITGFSINIGDPDGIVFYVKRLLSDPGLAKQMGINGRKFAETKFDFQQFKEKYISNRLELLGLK